MNYVIKLLELEGPSDAYAQGCVGKYVATYNPAERLLDVTDDINNARWFSDLMDAREYWRQSCGLRPDGLPDRPLTAYTVAFDSIG